MARRLDSLTGLRWAAAFAVFLVHADALIPAGRVHDVVARFSRQGGVGVSFFFILSGFVLTWSHQPGDRTGAFFRRRFARIAPVYWFALLITLPVFVAASEDSPLDTVLYALPSVPALQAWVPVPEIFSGGNLVGWSLSVEVFFYAVFPLLLLAPEKVWRSRWLPLVLPLVVVLIPASFLPGSPAADLGPVLVHVYPVLRLPEFLAGIALAHHLRAGGRPRVGLPSACVLALVAYLLAGWLPLWSSVLVMFVPFCLLIVVAATADVDESPSWFRDRRWVVLGQWSYAFYLLHLAVIKVVGATNELVSSAVWMGLVSVPVALLASVCAAALTYRWVERPMEARLRPARPRAETLSPRG